MEIQNNASKNSEGSKKQSTSSGAAQTSGGASTKKKQSNKAGKKKAQSPPIPSPRAPPKPTINSAKKTPVKQRARSATPASASKKSPLQMVKQDHPAGFEHTKEVFYVHIKVLWGLVKKRAVPTTPLSEQLAVFYQQFSTTEQIDSAFTGGPNLVALDTINTLREAREKRIKVGKHITNISDFHVQYVHTSLLQIGLSAWNPNLNEQADSLYNEAHKICAIRSFLQLVAGGAYQYMNVNHVYVENFDLLKQTYDHYVHYSLAKIFNKEKKETGKHFRNEERKVLHTARERIKAKRYKFAINNNIPQRYVDIIKCVQAHTNDEFYRSKGVYIVKKLPFRSKSADLFFRRLDEVMKQSSLEEGQRDQSRRRVRVKDAPPTIFPKAPKGLPIDFYDPTWFNEKLPAQRQKLANIDAVAFLPNANNSLRFKDPIEKLKTKAFTEARWDEATKPYDLDFLAPEENETESEDDEQDSDYGESIDLNDTDGEDNDDEEEGEEYKDSNDDEDIEDDVNMRGDVDEDYKEFDDPDADMTMENYGKGSYSGGLQDNEWNAWQ